MDRLVVKDGIRQRLTDSIETALKLAKGIVVADFVDLDEKDPDRRKPFSEKRACPNGHQLELDEIEPRTFSFTPRTVPARYARASDTSWRLIRNW